jgi:hypothetical protein
MWSLTSIYMHCFMGKNVKNKILPEPNEKNSVAWVRERTIPTERQPLVGEVSANFCGQRVTRGQSDGSLRPSLKTQIFPYGISTKITILTIVYTGRSCSLLTAAMRGVQMGEISLAGLTDRMFLQSGLLGWAAHMVLSDHPICHLPICTSIIAAEVSKLQCRLQWELCF